MTSGMVTAFLLMLEVVMRKYAPALIVAASFVSTGCVSGTVDTAVMQVSSCPATDFRDFVSLFTEREDIQRKFVNIPLRKLTLDHDAVPEPTPFVRTLDFKEVAFPVIPNAAARGEKSLSIRFDKVLDSEAQISLFVEDSDYLVSYIFGKAGSCWRLMRVEDWSL